MPDLTPVLLPQIRSRRLPDLDLGREFIHPDYAGGSIMNLPDSLCQLLGVPLLGAAPLRPEYLAPLGEGLRNVILVVVDALALHRLQRWLAQGLAPAWDELAQTGLLAPLTSIVPSTTSAALTSLWTGRSVLEHGIVGYEMWMKEYGVVANTIQHMPITFRPDNFGQGSLSLAGFEPEAYLPWPTLGTHLAAHGVETHVFQHQRILHSGLSKMYFKDVKMHGFLTGTDLWIDLRQILESPAEHQRYFYIYWSEVDTYSHIFGPDDERAAAEFDSFSTSFERLFLSRLSSQARAETAILLVADHGQVTTTPDSYYALREHPNLLRRLHILPTGENRLIYLFIRPGQREAVREYIERTWPNQFFIIDSAFALDAGLFGPGAAHPFLLDRVGEYTVIAKDHAYLWWAQKENRLIGRHGGLHPDEMLVPFLAARL